MNKEYEEILRLGLLRVEEKNYIESKSLFLKLTKIDPKRYEGHLNLSNILAIQNKTEEAEQILKNYLEKIYTHPEIINGLSIAFFNSKKYDELNNHIDKYIKTNNNYLLNYLKGFCLNNINKTSAAEKYLQKSINMKEDFWHSYELLFNIFDLRSKLSEMCALIEIAKKNFLKDIKFEYFYALYSYRNSEYIKCDQILNQDLLKSYFQKNHNNSFTSDYYNLLSKNYEKMSNKKKCLEYALKRNKTILNLEKNKNFNKHELLDTISSYTKFFNNDSKHLLKISDEGLEHSNLTFLIGFPRSGTTLLDTILRAHSKTIVLEEKPYLINIRHKFFKKNRISKLLNLDSRSKIEMQESYLNSFNYDSNKIIIDKFPLNLIELGFIKSIFPNSKIILAIRHPLDCILSCVLTSFKINEAMMNFENLKTTAFFYNKTFNLLLNYINFFDIELYKIKYEDVVSNFNFQISNLLHFLGLEFEDKIINFHETAKKREKIHTPSYDQVVKPIYTSSLNRYTGFEEITTIVDDVESWINYFNYKNFK